MDGFTDSASFQDDDRNLDNDHQADRNGRDDRDDRSRSPRRERNDDRARSASPNGRAGGDHAPPRRDFDRLRDEGDEPNAGSNLYVTGIATGVSDDELRDLFLPCGEVESASVMRDPHTRESRGFGFVKMVTSDMANAAMDKINGQELAGRTIGVQLAKRNRPRTPTPGNYRGPPKRGDPRDRRFDDRRGPRRDDRGYGGGYGRRGGGDRFDGDRYSSYDRRDRGYGGGGGYDSGSRRDDRYRSAPRDDRGGYGGGGYSDGYGGGSAPRSYDDRERR